MSTFIVSEQLAAEEAVVILEPLDQFPWLREHGLATSGPIARPERMPGYRLIAYSTARRRRGQDFHQRRVWFVKARDHLDYGDVDWPIEAVDPASIAPRCASRPMGLPPWRQAVSRGDSPASPQPHLLGSGALGEAASVPPSREHS